MSSTHKLLADRVSRPLGSRILADSTEVHLSTPRSLAGDKPTIAYVFRGMRTEFGNPLYDPKYPETHVPPPDAEDPSEFPPEHPDLESESYCPPKLLFAEPHTKSKRRRSRKGKKPSTKRRPVLKKTVRAPKARAAATKEPAFA